jgi:hypothetical protein
MDPVAQSDALFRKQHVSYEPLATVDLVFALESYARRMTAASPYVKDPRVDAYRAPLPDWPREIFERVRDLVHEADADVEQTIKRTVEPYFVLNLPVRPDRSRSGGHRHGRSRQQALRQIS